MTSRPLLLAAALLTAPLALAAQSEAGAAGPIRTPAPGVAVVLEGGVEFGGERLIRLTFTDGSTQNLTAGQGGTIAAGLQFRPAAAPRFSVSGTIGYKFVTNASENASIGITRIPVEVVGRYMLDQDWWAGAGFTMHSSTHINGDGFIPDADLDAASGPTVELGWRWIALTYTAMQYEDAVGESFDASAIGFMFRWVPKARR